MKKVFLPILAILILSIFTLIPLFHNGFFSVHDNTQVPRVFEMFSSLRDGVFPVRWVQDLGYGYGYPIFNFYSPLPYYIGGFLSFIFTSLVATKIMFGIGIIVSGISMYLLVNAFYGKKAGVLSSAIYLYFPYHAVNLYVRGAVGEFYAYAFLPLVFLGLFKILEARKTKNNFFWILLSSVSIALVLISHNLTALMLYFLLFIFMAISLVFAKRKTSIAISYGVILLLSFALSSFYVIPAFLEMKYTNVASQLVVGGASYADHFVCPIQLWDSQWGFGGSAKGCLDGMSYKIGKLNSILAILSVAVLVFAFVKKKKESLLIPILSVVLFIVSLFMTLQASEFLWKSIPYMGYIQYPWRFLNFSGLFLAILCGFMVSQIRLKNQLVEWGAVVILIVITIFMNAKLFQPVNYSNYDNAYYTDKNYIRTNTSKISDEYLPPNFSKPDQITKVAPTLVEVTRGESDIKVLAEKTGYLKLSFDSAVQSRILVGKAYFPAWKAYINSQQVQILPFAQGMFVDIPVGTGIIELKFESTALETLGNYLSLLGLICVVIAIIYRAKLNKNGE